MERIAQEVFSMRMMVVALFVFLTSIGLATFVETVYDTQTAKLVIYNASWFAILLLYLCAGMVANIIRYRMFRAEKISILTFHIAFIVMILGAAVTRYFGFEGTMLIREGQTVDYMFSAEPYLLVTVSDLEDATPYEKPLWMSEAFDPTFEDAIPLRKKNGIVKKNVAIECVDYKKNMVDSLVTSKEYSEVALGFALTSMQPEFICEGEFKMLGDVALSYEKDDAMPGVHIWKDGNKLKMKSVVGLRSLAMTQMRAIRESGEMPADSLYDVVLPDSVITLQKETLYNVQGQQFVLKEIRKNTKRELRKSSRTDEGLDYLFVRLKMNGETSDIIEIPGGFKRIAYNNEVLFPWKDLNFKIAYGSKQVPLPFSVRCDDFRLERYPGSNNPSSFESDLVLIDEVNNKRIKKELFMNHVADFQGYRLFQSSYDPDEKGTILSVNYDWWGTNISYLGYLLMGLGMILALFAPSGRTRELLRKISAIKEKKESLPSLLILIAFGTSVVSFAQTDATEEKHTPDTVQMQAEGHEGHNHEGHDHEGHDHEGHDHDQDAVASGTKKVPKQGKFYIMSAEHSEELASLLVQSERHNRYMPMHTLCVQLLRKVHGNEKFKEYNAVQTVISMHMYPDYWVQEKVIKVSLKGGLRDFVGAGKYASFFDLLNLETGEFKFKDEYNRAHRKKDADRTELERKLLELADQFEVMTNIVGRDWLYLRILPVKDDPNKKWSSILQFDVNSDEFKVAVDYFGALNQACVDNGGFGTASDNLVKLKALQHRTANDELPSDSEISMEIAYNKMDVVKNSYRLFGLLGFVILIIALVGILNGSGRVPKWARILEKISVGLVIATTLYLGAGLVIRGLISGHVPWSDGYEALLFISLIAVLIGLFLYRLTKVILPAACLLAFFLLWMSNQNILNPEITSLPPVLKSYWLKIHVAIITGSYAPLGIGALLGLINFILFTARNSTNAKRINLTINQLTYATEIVITVGIVMLTIGTFLGGVWANESWGRYWGWDPKETWALVAILAYAVVLHLRFIPGLKDKFTFNALALWAYATILFTYFGVNFYLVGLHSYANGDGLAEIPSWIQYFVLILFLFMEVASFRNQRFKSKDGSIPTKFFTRKIIILYALILGVAIMMLIFKVSPFATVAANTGIVMGLIGLTTLVQYMLGRSKRDVSEEFDQI